MSLVLIEKLIIGEVKTYKLNIFDNGELIAKYFVNDAIIFPDGKKLSDMVFDDMVIRFKYISYDDENKIAHIVW